MKSIDMFLSDESGEPQGEFIPLLADDEMSPLETSTGDELPVLSLRNMVLFPSVVMPVSVGRKKSLRLIRVVYQREG